MNRCVVLASRSPRRRALLEEMGISVSLAYPDIQERVHPGEIPEEYVHRMALVKAEAVAKQWSPAWIVAADTVVVLGNTILGKPTDEGDAERILRLLSGTEHCVTTAVAVVQRGNREQRQEVRREATLVRFFDLTTEQIRWYVQTGEPMDKAGAYGIQGLGRLLVKEIRGDYYNVVGLPCALCARMLEDLGFPVMTKLQK